MVARKASNPGLTLRLKRFEMRLRALEQPPHPGVAPHPDTPEDLPTLTMQARASQLQGMADAQATIATDLEKIREYMAELVRICKRDREEAAALKDRCADLERQNRTLEQANESLWERGARPRVVGPR
jgi:hypothetical protein